MELLLPCFHWIMAITDYHKDQLTMYFMLRGIGRDELQDHFLNSFRFFLERRKNQSCDIKLM